MLQHRFAYEKRLNWAPGYLVAHSEMFIVYNESEFMMEIIGLKLLNTYACI